MTISNGEHKPPDELVLESHVSTTPHSVAIQPDGDHVVSVDSNGLVRIWMVPQMKVVVTRQVRVFGPTGTSVFGPVSICT